MAVSGLQTAMDSLYQLLGIFFPPVLYEQNIWMDVIMNLWRYCLKRALHLHIAGGFAVHMALILQKWRQAFPHPSAIVTSSPVIGILWKCVNESHQLSRGISLRRSDKSEVHVEEVYGSPAVSWLWEYNPITEDSSRSGMSPGSKQEMRSWWWLYVSDNTTWLTEAKYPPLQLHSTNS